MFSLGIEYSQKAYKFVTAGLVGESLIYMIATLLPKASGIFLMPIRTHYLTASDFGVMGTLGTVAGFLGILAGLGLRPALTLSNGRVFLLL